MTIINKILKRYYTNLQQWSLPPDQVALEAITKTLQEYNYVVITRSLYRDLSERPVRENSKEAGK